MSVELGNKHFSQVYRESMVKCSFLPHDFSNVLRCWLFNVDGSVGNHVGVANHEGACCRCVLGHSEMSAFPKRHKVFINVISV
jgi:hypothetical protein